MGLGRGEGVGKGVKGVGGKGLEDSWVAKREGIGGGEVGNKGRRRDRKGGWEEVERVERVEIRKREGWLRMVRERDEVKCGGLGRGVKRRD